MEMRIRTTNVTPSFDGPNHRKLLGLIALATDLTCERDFARLLPYEQAGLYVSRVAFANPTTPENLRKMGPDIAKAADLLLPGHPLSAICYACTAASVVMGDENIEASVHTVRAGVPVVTPSGAAMKAFRALGVSRVSVLTPYLEETSAPFKAYFEKNGLTIKRFHCFGLEDDGDMARLDHKTILEAALATDTEASEAFFLSCTALQAVDAVKDLERLTGKPVVTSNQACIWEMAGHADLRISAQKWGQLFDMPCPAGDP